MRSAELRFRRAHCVAEARALGALDRDNDDGAAGFPRHVAARPGLLLLRGLLCPREQEELSRACLGELLAPPHRRNVDADGRAAADAAAFEQPPHRGGGPISWSSFGFHYDWTVRRYVLPEDADAAALIGPATPWFSPVPTALQLLGARVIGACAAGLELRPEAGIVNFYAASPRIGRSFPMGAHRDDLERTFRAPVASISLGCTAVFLVGGSDKGETPSAVVLRSGDAVVLSGPARLAFHAVPVVFPPPSMTDLCGFCRGQADAPAPALFEGEGEGASKLQADGEALAERAALRAYLRAHRINVNLRQVRE